MGAPEWLTGIRGTLIEFKQATFPNSGSFRLLEFDQRPSNSF